MKVLSIKEPWASLIAAKVKYIETRSWQTKYRGELYIHASQKKLTKHELNSYEAQISLLKEPCFKYGSIIAKCRLSDCILMDETLIKKVKANKNEYICGLYEPERYAWLLEDVEILSEPIVAKGQLGIWTYHE